MGMYSLGLIPGYLDLSRGPQASSQHGAWGSRSSVPREPDRHGTAFYDLASKSYIIFIVVTIFHRFKWRKQTSPLTEKGVRVTLLEEHVG